MRKIWFGVGAAVVAAAVTVVVVQLAPSGYRLYTFDVTVADELHIENGGLEGFGFNNPSDSPVRLTFAGAVPFSPDSLYDQKHTIFITGQTTDWVIPPHHVLNTSLFDASKLRHAVAFSSSWQGKTSLGLVAADVPAGEGPVHGKIPPPTQPSWSYRTVAQGLKTSIPFLTAIGGLLIGLRISRRRATHAEA